MMIEFWWKVFLAGIVTTAVAKVLGCQWNIFFVFAIASAAWVAGLLLIINISSFLWERRRKDKEGKAGMS